MKLLVIILAVFLWSIDAADHENLATTTATSGMKLWVDPATPVDRHTYISSRGDAWELVMSDEFDTPGRSFRPGHDHLWTSIEKPDGVNHALEIYSHNMTTTVCEYDSVTNEPTICYFQIQITEELTNLTVWNEYKKPPGYQNVSFFYRAGMVQTWNKFCFQGGMIEVRAQLPGAVSPESQNPDLRHGPSGRVNASAFYPTWPGIWMMGNLGRALFSASTNRMWPFSYNQCDPNVFEPSNQRISACDTNPGHGLNPNQGRGAPEIDLLEGGGTMISSSIQLGPGMPSTFRTFKPQKKLEGPLGYEYMVCMYTDAGCKSPGANQIGVPTALYNKRKHKSWYQGLKYAANNFCRSDAALKQSYATIQQSLARGITLNKCSAEICPASFDVNADLSFLDNSTTDHWGINANGTCFPVINSYMGSYLCSPGNPAAICKENEENELVSTLKSTTSAPFHYQMDAISANWPIHMAAYLDFLVYQVEWVTGDTGGYVRWMLDGHPIFEIPSEAITQPPQDENQRNPIKLMPEEPMYLILNVALSSTWGATPPNVKETEHPRACRDHLPTDSKATIAQNERICDAFPLYMKIDYVRLYQDVSPTSTMSIGCDPASHPTKQWILDHLKEYQDAQNPMVDVQGGAFCRSHDDCNGANGMLEMNTGVCENHRCKCLSSAFWGGPRCMVAIHSEDPSVQSIANRNRGTFGPPLGFTLSFAAAVFMTTTIVITSSMRRANERQAQQLKHQYGRVGLRDHVMKSPAPELVLPRLSHGTKATAVENGGSMHPIEELQEERETKLRDYGFLC